MGGNSTRRVLIFMLITVLIITGLPIAANAGPADYDPAAVSAINRVITENGLTGYRVNEPDYWDFVYWDDSSPKQLRMLLLYEMDISGELVLTDLKSLEYLSCNNNQLTGIILTGCTALETLYCFDNLLTKLEVSDCTALKELYYARNQLTSLDITNLTKLERLHCADNQITSLDIANLTKLELLLCDYNPLTTLDVSKNTSLKRLDCNNSQLISLDVTGLTDLETLFCDENQLTSLDLSTNISLELLFCKSNMLSSLDLSANSALDDLVCGGNILTELDVSKNTALKELYCDFNLLTSLDVSKNTKLEFLHCCYNKLTKLDVTGLNALTYLDCSYNYMKSRNDVIGYNSSKTEDFTFDPQKSEPINIMEKFKDLKAGAWYLDAIDLIVNCGLFEGVSDTEFDPDGNMSRAMFVQVLKRLSDIIGYDTSVNLNSTFKDVKSGAWYEKAVTWAAETGVVTGYDANTFGPDDSITREQMAVMLIRYIDYIQIVLESAETTPFTDVEKISSWAADAVEKAAAGGLVSGVGDGRFDPLNIATRAQVAKLFCNLLEKYFIIL